MKIEPLARLLAYFRVNANKFYIYLQCLHIVFILQCQNVQTTAKLSEKSIVPIIFNGVLYHVCHLYCYRFLSSHYINQVPEKLYFG